MIQIPLRILVVLPCYGGSLPSGQYCVSALKDLGHIVEFFDAPAFWGTITAFKELRIRNSKVEELEASFLQVISQAIYAKAIEFEPDLVLCLAQAPVTRQLLKRFKKDGILTAMWFVEDFSVFTYWRSFAPLYDFFFVIQKEPFLEELKAIGVAHSVYLPLAADPKFHRPLELSPIDQRSYSSEISFVGAGYPNRRIAFRQLMQFQCKIWGADWDGESILAPILQNNGQRISPEDGVKIFNATTININLHSSIKVKPLVSNGDFVNPRTFEIASCGAFQLVDNRQLLPELFTTDEFVTFETIDDLKEKIHYFINHPEERAQFAAQARHRILAEHTYQHRMKALLDTIAAQHSHWPKERCRKEFPDVLSDEHKVELEELFTKLHLPAESSFEDVILMIRQQTGVLSPLETSLLFLDEWQKLYKK